MGCPDENTLAEYVDNVLDAPRRRTVDSHLDACPACRAVISDLARMQHAIAENTLVDAVENDSTIGEPAPVRGSALTIDVARHRTRTAQVVPGTMIGEYEVTGKLGEGGVGVVYAAVHPRIGKKAAIKILQRDHARDQKAIARFEREARAVNAIGHPNIVDIFAFDELPNGDPYYVMEQVQGQSLLEWISQRAPVSLDRAMPILRQICDALSAAHERGIIHRDLKPGNIMVGGTDDAPRVKVLDFGLAKMQRDDNDVGDLTHPGIVIGTPYFMSPEQFGAREVDQRTDVYALGVLIYQMLSGVYPFQGGTPSAVKLQHLHHTPRPLSKVSGLPERLDPIIDKALAKHVAARYRTVRELCEDLEQCVVETSGHGALADPPIAHLPPPEPSAPPRSIAPYESRSPLERSATAIRPQRSRWPVLVIAGTLATAAIIFASISRSTSRPPQARPAFTAPTKLFDGALGARMAVSPDGKWIALSGDGLVVRSVDLVTYRRAELPMGASNVLHVDFDGGDIRFSLSNTSRWRWRFATDGAIVMDAANLPGQWRGSTVAGELVYLPERTLALVGPDGVPQPWGRIHVLAISPNRQRVAYIEGGRFTGTIVVRDVLRPAHVIRSNQLDEPAALSWHDDTTLVFSTSTLHEPRIQRATVDATSFLLVPPDLLAEPIGWYAEMAIASDTLFFISMHPDPLSRMVDLDSGQPSDLGSIALALGWDADGRLITWDRTAHNVELRTYPTPSRRDTGVLLEVEPVNATMSDQTLIATLRRSGGRETIAFSIAPTDGGKALWKHADNRTLAVRCVADRARPCFAVRSIDETRDEVVSLDPTTGELGTEVIYADDGIEDIAVSADGHRLLVAGRFLLRTVDLSTRVTSDVTAVDAPITATVRSVAITPDGTIFLASTVSRNRYQVGMISDGVYRSLAESNDQVLAFVRPSRDGRLLTFVARQYRSELLQMPLPR